MVVNHLKLLRISGGRTTQSLRKSWGQFLAVGVLAEQNRPRSKVLAQLLQSVQTRFRLIMRILFVLNCHNSIREAGAMLNEIGVVGAEDYNMRGMTLAGQPSRLAE